MIPTLMNSLSTYQISTTYSLLVQLRRLSREEHMLSAAGQLCMAYKKKSGWNGSVLCRRATKVFSVDLLAWPDPMWIACPMGSLGTR